MLSDRVMKIKCRSLNTHTHTHAQAHTLNTSVPTTALVIPAISPRNLKAEYPCTQSWHHVVHSITLISLIAGPWNKPGFISYFLITSHTAQMWILKSVLLLMFVILFAFFAFNCFSSNSALLQKKTCIKSHFNKGGEHKKVIFSVEHSCDLMADWQISQQKSGRCSCVWIPRTHTDTTNQI